MSLANTLSQHPIAGSFIVDQNLPPGGSILVDFDQMVGSVSGTFAAGTTYSVTYLLLDPGECPIVEFEVLVTGEGEGPNDGPSQIPGTTPPTRACMTISAVVEVPGFLFFPATTSDLSTTIIVNSEQERVTPFQLCEAVTTQFALNAGETAYGPDQSQASFDRWEKYDPIEQTWISVGESPYIYVPLQAGSSYRAVFAEGSIGTTTPTPSRQQQVCLSVSAVFMYQRIATTALFAQPQFVAEPINPQILVGEEARDAPFQLCGAPGTRYVLVPQEEYWTIEENRLEFWKWQRYNAETETWDDILQLLFGNVQPGQLTVNLQSGGQLRAVYRQNTEVY